MSERGLSWALIYRHVVVLLSPKRKIWVLSSPLRHDLQTKVPWKFLNAIASLENKKHVLELKHNTPSPVHFLLYLSCKLRKSLFMKAFLPQLSHNITFNALHQLPPPNVFLWSAPEPCSPLGKWLDWVPPKRYQDTTHTTQHRWDQLLLLNHS